MKDSGHYYDFEGNAVFEVPNKSKGGTRGTTIADAKKMNLLPSVTTIFKVLAKPELDRWKQMQVLMASLTLPKIEGEDDDTYCARIIEDAFKQVGDAADLGTRVHKAIEDHFQGRPYDESLKVYVEAVDKWVTENGVTFLAHELRLVSPEYGYAGTTDAHITATGRKGTHILDFKTRKSKPKYPMTPWQTEPMQISAYAKVLKADGGVNLYISTTEPGRVEATWYEESRLSEEFQAFQLTSMLWRFINKFPYNPPTK